MTTKSDLDTTLEEVKKEFRNLVIKRRELITRLGSAFESVVSNPESVCEEIKNSLQEEIADRIISARDIERYCPDKWKKKTKPKNDKLSFSKSVEGKPQQQVAPTQEGKSVIINETYSNTGASDGVNEPPDQSKQNGIGIDDNNEAQITAANQGKSVSYNEPNANTQSSTIDDSVPPDAVQKLLSHPSDKQIGQECSSCLELQDKVIELNEALKRTSIRTADQIPAAEFEFTIPKEKYEMVRDAMDKSKGSIFVKCDESRTFVRADPDVYN
ncbi:MAG: hypothetical protein WA323_10445 [Candidatus Nitrosopolaris sp.]